MKKLINKEFEILIQQVIQDPISQSVTVASALPKNSFYSIIESELRKSPQQGFDPKLMIERMDAIKAIKDKSINEEFEIEDAIYNTIVECSKNFKPGFASDGMLDFLKYVEELEKQK